MPFESYNADNFLVNLSYWLSHVLILAGLSGFVARRAFPRFVQQETSPVWALVQFSLTLSVPVYLISVLYELAAGPEADDTVAALLWWAFDTALYTLIIVGGISIAAVKFAAKPAAPGPPAGQRFFNRLSPSLGSELVCLSMEDHYIRVHTQIGNELIHLSMKDALSELDGYPGFQVHRSWWVSVSGLTHVNKEQRKYTAHLTNGLAVPISRNHVEKLKEAGFL